MHLLLDVFRSLEEKSIGGGVVVDGDRVIAEVCAIGPLEGDLIACSVGVDCSKEAVEGGA